MSGEGDEKLSQSHESCTVNDAKVHEPYFACCLIPWIFIIYQLNVNVAGLVVSVQYPYIYVYIYIYIEVH